MRQLETEYKRNKQHVDLKLVKRGKRAAIYACGSPDVWIRGGYFEVIRVRTTKDRQAFGATFPASEVYPPSAKWGTDGFTEYGYGAALRKFKEIENKHEKTSKRKRV